MDLISAQYLYIKSIYPYLIIPAIFVFYAYFIKALKAKKNYGILFISLVLPIIFYFFNSTPDECQSSPQSEACVWGKAYAPLTVGIKVFLTLPILFLLLSGVKELWQKSKERS